MWPTDIITICKYLIGSWWCVNRSTLCYSGPSVKSKSQVYLCASYEYLTLRTQHNTTWKSKHKICTNFDHYWTKKWSFLCMQTNWVCQREALRFCKKMTLTRVSSRVKSFCEKRDSSRVESLSFSTWLESSHSHQKSWLESSHWLE